MMSEDPREQTLTAVVTPKQETMQYLGVDSATYIHWRALLQSLGLGSDTDLASFLLQHFEKTSNLQLTQCVKCGGPVVQYCVPCNIYMTQPTTPPLPLTLLGPEGATGLPVTSEDSILSSDAILLDFGDVSSEQFLLQDIALKADSSRTDNSGSKHKREITAVPSTSAGGSEGPKAGMVQPSRLRMLIETSSKEGLEPSSIKLAIPKLQTSGGAAARSLLTPNVLRNLRAAQHDCGEKAVTTSAIITRGDDEDFAQPSVSTDFQATEKAVTTSATITRGDQDFAQPSVSTDFQATEKAITTSATIKQDCAQPLESTDSQASAPTSSQMTQAGSSEGSGPQPLQGDDPASAESATPPQPLHGDDPASAKPSQPSCPPAAQTTSLKATQPSPLHITALHELSELLLQADFSLKAEKPSGEEVELVSSIVSSQIKAADSMELAESVTGEQTSESAEEKERRLFNSTSASTAEVHACSETRPEQPASKTRPEQSTTASTADVDNDDACSDGEVTLDLRVKEQSHSEMSSQPWRKDDAEKREEGSRSRLTRSPKKRSLTFSRMENVPEEDNRWQKDDDDSDYHYEPLFPVRHHHHHHHGDQTSHTSTSSGQEEGWASTHRVQTHTSTELRTRSSPRKRQRSLSSTSKETDSATLKISSPPRKRLRPGSKENSGTGGKPQGSGKRSRSEGQVVSRSEGQVVSRSEGRVIIVKDKEGGLPPSRHCSPTAEKDGDSETPGSRRPQRVAASKASRVWKPVTVEVSDDGDNDDDPASDANDQVGNVSEDVSHIKTEVSQACSLAVRAVDDEISHGAADAAKEASDTDGSKVSVLLEPELQKRAAIIAWKQKRLEEQKAKKQKPSPCAFCGEKFPTGLDRLAHVKEKHGPRPYPCPDCGVTYTKLAFLKAHIKQHHAKVKANICPQCQRSFSRARDLEQHLQKPCPDLETVCEVCGVTLKSGKFLKAHMRTHVQSDKPFVCQVCGRAFRWRGNLTDHLRIHSNDKPFTCNVCGVKYVQSGSLRRHIERRHNPNRPRPFICDMCGEARYDRYQFAKHMMIHTGERPYECQFCGASFIQVNALNDHMKIHTETDGKTHKCPVCGAAFKRLASVTKHMNKVHKARTLELPPGIVAEQIVEMHLVTTGPE
ncbi:hypothetical protein ACOMHN_044375 [Nucella lapillus]